MVFEEDAQQPLGKHQQSFEREDGVRKKLKIAPPSFIWGKRKRGKPVRLSKFWFKHCNTRVMVVLVQFTSDLGCPFGYST